MNIKSEPRIDIIRENRKIVGTIITTTVLTIIALLSIVIVPLHKSMRHSVEEDFFHSLAYRRALLEAHLSEINNVTSQISSRTQIRKALDRFNQGKIDQEELVKFTVPKLKDAMDHNPLIVGITRLDISGDVAVEVGIKLSPEMINEARNTFQGINIKKLETGKKELLIVAHVPIHDRERWQVGVDIVAFSTSYLSELLTRSMARFPEHVPYLAFTNTGNYPKYDFVFMDKSTDRLLLGSETELIPNSLIPDWTGQSIGMNQGNGSFFTYRDISTKGWQLVHFTTKDLLYGPVEKKIVLLIVILLFLIGLGASGTFMIVLPRMKRFALETHRREAAEEQITNAMNALSDKGNLQDGESDEPINKTLMDLIEARNTAKEKLKKSEHAHRTLAQNLPGIVFREHFQEGNGMQFFNDNYSIMTGFRQDELSKGNFCSFDPHIHPDDLPHVLKTVEEAILEKKSFHLEYRFCHKDGTLKTFVEQSTPIYDDDGELLFIDGVIFDITEIYETRIQLQESEELFRVLFHQGPDASILTKVSNGAITDINSFFMEYFHYNREEIIGKTAVEIGVWVDLSRRSEFYNEIEKYGQVVNFISEFRSRTGPNQTLLLSANKLELKGEAYILTHMRDITAMIQTQTALEISEDKLQTMLRATPAGTGLLSSDRKIQWGNDQLAKITGFELDELKSMDAIKLYESEEEYLRVGREKHAEVRASGMGSIETKFVRKDGIIVDILLSSAAIDPADFDKGLVFTALDITQRKEAEEQIRSSLKEKDILLREIHHRVKNNMQVISSLLRLQVQKEKDPAVLEIFEQSQSRIRSMALIHEQLYRSTDMAQIAFDDYLQKLVLNIRETLRCDSAPEIEVKAEGVCLSIDASVPCGLIVSELVTNAYKHAFSPGEKGKIIVEIAKDKDLMVLKVTDNGIGLPEDFDARKSESLGLQLVYLLGEGQLSGMVEIKQNNGTCFILTFRDAQLMDSQ